VPLGSKHRLENRGKTPLELIEVQTGSYFGEDDIERFEDDYRRKSDE
jgi:mannose-1-phosphate guanylyltransferase/mannose-6-phosphate isomerase